MTISIFHLPCKLVACVHRHCVFTIPEELRAYFLKDRSLLDCLFHPVRDVVLRTFSKMNKTENCTIYHSLFCHVIFYFQFIIHYF
ncbi:hypothetical protein DWX96_14035 [Roseburia sp. AF22-2LB]|nr:hypothetical protein DWY00_13660 [Roseburia sp. AF22-8AC]RGG39130.1 hypothetical protein DWX96_14035 [Roseburia sp. AF22-2LB]RGH27953.1 hypothetical protein DV740_09495 [Roseburia sp. AF02-12]RGI46022.1 hypothetical protein DXB39_12925 [Roseburia sp. OM03-7AC]RGI48248.1 hypothetical protein DXB35_12645 [Roseburia sp. OM03-18]